MIKIGAMKAVVSDVFIVIISIIMDLIPLQILTNVFHEPQKVEESKDKVRVHKCFGPDHHDSVETLLEEFTWHRCPEF